MEATDPKNQAEEVATEENEAAAPAEPEVLQPAEIAELLGQGEEEGENEAPAPAEATLRKQRTWGENEEPEGEEDGDEA